MSALKNRPSDDPIAQPFGDPSSLTPQTSRKSSKLYGNAWDYREERYFYEYLRIAPTRSKEQCCSQIAAALDKRDIQSVIEFYDLALDTMKRALKDCNVDWDDCPESRLHKALVYHWDKTLVSGTIMQHAKSEKKTFLLFSHSTEIEHHFAFLLLFSFDETWLLGATHQIDGHLVCCHAATIKGATTENICFENFDHNEGWKEERKCEGVRGGGNC